jgi:hypothetical protein
LLVTVAFNVNKLPTAAKLLVDIFKLGGGWESKILSFLDLPLSLVLPFAIANSIEANAKLARESGFVGVQFIASVVNIP